AVAGRGLKPMVMELGGSDPFIVLEDADLDLAVATGVQSRCLNSGQSCIAAKRFLVHRSRFDAFAERFAGAMQARVMGDPFEPEVHIGPLAREDLRDRLADQVKRSVAAGAEALCGA
ncbi:MAG: aldehyde dehydrogenase family protein, partial [Gemmatimonadetes bacterium]|nr:aldehyde dehydrogenase family protein [Gemmatimonadota bacterium]